MAKILIGYSACPLTRAAFEKHGHDVWTCDLLPARDGSPKHYQCDVWDVLGTDWDMAVLHPMCTYLTASAEWAYADPDYQRYPEVGYHQKLKPETLRGHERRVDRQAAIENPARGAISKAIRKPDQIIQPFEYGDDASKATGLWLSGGLPKLAGTAYVDPTLRPNGSYRWANQTDSGQNRLSPGDDRWLQRSATYPGIAAAMGDQWGRYMKELETKKQEAQ